MKIQVIFSVTPEITVASAFDLLENVLLKFFTYLVPLGRGENITLLIQKISRIPLSAIVAGIILVQSLFIGRDYNRQRIRRIEVPLHTAHMENLVIIYHRWNIANKLLLLIFFQYLVCADSRLIMVFGVIWFAET